MLGRSFSRLKAGFARAGEDLWRALTSDRSGLERAAHGLLGSVKPQGREVHFDGVLEPVTALNEIRGQGASTCFVIHVTDDDPANLERSIQSILRQTEPAWEILIAVEERVQTSLDAWLDTDWRIRRAPYPVGGKAGLLRSVAFATSDFVCLIAQGDVVDDFVVEGISRQSKCEPELPDMPAVEPPQRRGRSPTTQWKATGLAAYAEPGDLRVGWAIRKARLLEAISELA